MGNSMLIKSILATIAGAAVTGGAVYVAQHPHVLDPVTKANTHKPDQVKTKPHAKSQAKSKAKSDQRLPDPKWEMEDAEKARKAAQRESKANPPAKSSSATIGDMLKKSETSDDVEDVSVDLPEAGTQDIEVEIFETEIEGSLKPKETAPETTDLPDGIEPGEFDTAFQNYQNCVDTDAVCLDNFKEDVKFQAGLPVDVEEIEVEVEPQQTESLMTELTRPEESKLTTTKTVKKVTEIITQTETELDPNNGAVIGTVLSEIDKIDVPDLKNQAYLDVVEYALKNGNYETAKQTVPLISDIALQDTAWNRIALKYAVEGNSDMAFKMIDNLGNAEIADFVRLQVIQGLIAPERLPNGAVPQ